MRKLAYFVQIYVIVAFVCVTSTLAQNDQSDSEYSFWKNSVSRTEFFVRAAAKEQLLPVYPVSAIEAKEQGVVTVYVVFDELGKVSWTKILKSPSQAISDEVINVVKKWEVEPFVFSGERRRVNSHLRFVFEIKDNIPAVSAPSLQVQKTTCTECNDFRVKSLNAERRLRQKQ